MGSRQYGDTFHLRSLLGALRQPENPDISDKVVALEKLAVTLKIAADHYLENRDESSFLPSLIRETLITLGYQARPEHYRVFRFMAIRAIRPAIRVLPDLSLKGEEIHAIIFPVAHGLMTSDRSINEAAILALEDYPPNWPIPFACLLELKRATLSHDPEVVACAHRVLAEPNNDWEFPPALPLAYRQRSKGTRRRPARPDDQIPRFDLGTGTLSREIGPRSWPTVASNNEDVWSMDARQAQLAATLDGLSESGDATALARILEAAKGQADSLGYKLDVESVGLKETVLTLTNRSGKPTRLPIPHLPVAAAGIIAGWSIANKARDRSKGLYVDDLAFQVTRFDLDSDMKSSSVEIRVTNDGRSRRLAFVECSLTDDTGKQRPILIPKPLTAFRDLSRAQNHTKWEFSVNLTIQTDAVLTMVFASRSIPPEPVT